MIKVSQSLYIFHPRELFGSSISKYNYTVLIDAVILGVLDICKNLNQQLQASVHKQRQQK